MRHNTLRLFDPSAGLGRETPRNNSKTKTLHTMRKLAYSLLLTIAGTTAFGQSRTLEDCVGTALASNLQVRNSSLDITAADHKIREVKAALLPTVELNGQYLYYPNLPSQYAQASAFGGPEGQYTKMTLSMPQTTSATIQVKQNLFNKAVLTGLQAAEAYKETARFQSALTRENLVYSVTATYLTIQVLNDNLQRLKENIQNLEKVVKIQSSLKQNDLVTENTYNRLLINLENLKNQYEATRMSQSRNITMLQYLMNVKDTVIVESLRYNDPLVRPDLGDIAFRSDIQLQQSQVELAQLEKKSITAKYFPVLTASQNYTSTSYYKEFAPTKQINNDWINSNSFSLNLKIPLFDGFEKKYQVKQKDAAIQKNLNTLSLMKSDARRQLQDASINYDVYQAQFISNRESLELATRLFETSQGEYGNGLTSTTEFLNAQNDLSNARNNYTNALLNLKLAELDLRKANGTLLSNN
ncbi:MAG: TolC family protein [Cyclobacteriaceae bacterium]|nr:TolC family protein [Cyclobacteriaceae bacterium]